MNVVNMQHLCAVLHSIRNFVHFDFCSLEARSVNAMGPFSFTDGNDRRSEQSQHCCVSAAVTVVAV